MKEKKVLLLVFLLVSSFFIGLMPSLQGASAAGSLQIVSVTPINNTINVLLNTRPTVIFNQQVDKSSLAGSINGVPIVSTQAVFSNNDQTLTLDLGAMEYQKTYSITIKSAQPKTQMATNGN